MNYHCLEASMAPTSWHFPAPGWPGPPLTTDGHPWTLFHLGHTQPPLPAELGPVSLHSEPLSREAQLALPDGPWSTPW